MLGGTLSTSPAQFTASMFVNKTKTTLRAHTVDKNTSSVCRSKRRFRPKPHAPVLFLSIYRDTVPLTLNVHMQVLYVITIQLEQFDFYLRIIRNRILFRNNCIRLFVN